MSLLLSQYSPHVYDRLQNGLHVCETDGAVQHIPGNEGGAPRSRTGRGCPRRLFCVRACSCGESLELDEALPLQGTKPPKPGLEAPKGVGKPQWPLRSSPWTPPLGRASLKFLKGVTYSGALKLWSVAHWGHWNSFRVFEVQTASLIIMFFISLSSTQAVGFSRGSEARGEGTAVECELTISVFPQVFLIRRVEVHMWAFSEINSFKYFCVPTSYLRLYLL